MKNVNNQWMFTLQSRKNCYPSLLIKKFVVNSYFLIKNEQSWANNWPGGNNWFYSKNDCSICIINNYYIKKRQL